MSNEIVPQTANAAAQSESAPAQLELQPIAAPGESATPEPKPKAQPETIEESGAKPAGQPKVVEELIHTRKRAQTAEERANALEAENAYLKQQAESAARASVNQMPQKPNIVNYDTNEDFERDMEIYEKKAQEYHEQKGKQEALKELQQKNIHNEYKRRFDEAVKTLPDLPQVINAPHINQLSQTSPAIIDAIKESEMGPQLAYHLAKNPGDTYRLINLSPWAAARELGKLEVRLSQEQILATTKKISDAPPPINPGNGSAVSLETDLADLPAAEYAKARLAQLNKR